MRTAIVLGAVIIGQAINTEATKLLLSGGWFVIAIFVFFIMDILDFGKSRN